ncbi:hypothetical protein SBA2_350019 [Acidobacteriia bacterium SbA2]|nr:hypothetical protein SBA2_350019 [Acidobacteriia bacterium SbA2]
MLFLGAATEPAKPSKRTRNVFENKGTLDSLAAEGETSLLAVVAIRGGQTSCRLNRRTLGGRHRLYSQGRESRRYRLSRS